MLVLIALAFWLGGFTFYTAVVVPVGTRVLGGAAEQGFVTREVTIWINLATAIALLPLCWDAVATPSGRRIRLACCFGILATLVALFFCRARLEQLLDPEAGRVRDREVFRPWHRTYLWLTTLQFVSGFIFLATTPWAWRRDDAHRCPRT